MTNSGIDYLEILYRGRFASKSRIISYITYP